MGKRQRLLDRKAFITIAIAALASVQGTACGETYYVSTGGDMAPVYMPDESGGLSTFSLVYCLSLIHI